MPLRNDADQEIHPHHFGSEEAETRIRILDHLWLWLDALAEVCAV